MLGLRVAMSRRRKGGSRMEKRGRYTPPGERLPCGCRVDSLMHTDVCFDRRCDGKCGGWHVLTEPPERHRA